MGIVDGGLDVSHPSFFSTDGTTYRVKRFVDDYTEAGETIGKDKGSDPLCAKKAKQVDICFSRWYYSLSCFAITK